jgi:RHS repeat-associated protein
VVDSFLHSSYPRSHFRIAEARHCTQVTLNRLQTPTPPAAISSGNFGFGYDALSRRTSLTRPNSVNTSYSYDALSRLLSVTHAKSGTTLDGATYTVDNAGNRLTRTPQPTGTASTFAYDNIYELLSVTQSGSTTESYTYDPVGNRLTNLGSAAWSYNTSNELNSRPSFSYTYDYNGSVLTSVSGTNTTSYAWDFENRLSTVTLPGSGGTVSFKYDPFGRRVYKSSSAATSIYAYDGINLIEEANSSGAAVARYSQGWTVDEPLAMLRSGMTSYYEADGLGSITSLSTTAGALAQTYTIDSFGRLIASSGSLTNPFQYTGREFDTETSLYFYRARYFDPQIGRFFSEDPLGYSVGPNFYAYVLNNSVNDIDPAGLDPYDIFKRARKGLKKASCIISITLCNIGEQVSALNSMTSDDKTNTTFAQQAHGPATGQEDYQRLQLCLAADKNCETTVQCLARNALTNPLPPPWWGSDLLNYFSQNPQAPAPPIKRE